MMLETDVNSLEIRKTELEVQLNDLIKSGTKEVDKINELRSEILYLKKQIKKKLGPKEVEIQSRIKRKKLGIDERNISNYNAFKERYKKISKIEVSTKNILKVIDAYFNKAQYENNYNMMKVMSR